MRVFGLIGFPLSHSFSKKYFTEKFGKEGYSDCIYENFEIRSINEFTTLFNDHPFISGLNVTIPYKEKVIDFLDFKSKVVEQTGACNCICVIDKKRYGHNTDTIGFEQSLTKKLLPHHTKALILGTGGAAKAIAYVLENLQISYLYVSRKNVPASGVLTYENITHDILREHTLIINTTPAGMYPETNAAPPVNYKVLTPRHYLFDLIYNPEKTMFLQLGEERGAAIANGHEMLIIQAEESWKLWNAL